MSLRDADTLIIAGNSKPQEIEALKAIYGTGATVRVATSGDDVVGILTGYSSIKRLVIGTHGSQGDIIIRGTHISIGKLAASVRLFARG